jgi:hypothetical protein
MYNGVEIVCRYFLIQYLKITVVTEIYFVRYRTVVKAYMNILGEAFYGSGCTVRP